MREHAAELNSQLDRAHALLMPVLTAIEIRDSLSTRGKEVPAEVSIGSADPPGRAGHFTSLLPPKRFVSSLITYSQEPTFRVRRRKRLRNS